MENPYYAHKDLMKENGLDADALPEGFPEDLKEHVEGFEARIPTATEPDIIEEMQAYSDLIMNRMVGWMESNPPAPAPAPAPAPKPKADEPAPAPKPKADEPAPAPAPKPAATPAPAPAPAPKLKDDDDDEGDGWAIQGINNW